MIDSLLMGVICLCLLKLVSQATIIVEAFDIAIYSRSRPGSPPLHLRPSCVVSQWSHLSLSPSLSSSSSNSAEKEEAVSTDDGGEESSMIRKLKDELLEIATKTNRGFKALSNDRKRAKDILIELAKYNPTKEPASPYYYSNEEISSSLSSSPTPTLCGKWTLIYTDAPDITSLDRTTPTAKLGRIGQECNPPYIKNVIEWLKPDWVPSNLPFSGTTKSRILQKVVTSGTSSPAEPLVVNLSVAGIELESGKKEMNNSDTENTDSTSIVQKIQDEGLPAGLLSSNPIDIKGPLNPPFGKFTVLYLDDEFRAIQTYQNYVAVNQRIVNLDDEWF